MERGCLGNTLRNWRTVAAASKSGCFLFGVRQIGIGGGGLHQIVPAYSLAGTIYQWEREGLRYIIDEAAPDSDVVLQGEICRTFRGWEGLLGLRTQNRMRESMRRGLLRPYSGLAVKVLLDDFVDPNSRADIEAILELYPNATIELASYPYFLGKIPGRNTIIWEVRDY